VQLAAPETGLCHSVQVGDLPSGTVTFLFTDIEGSTRLWEERRGEMEEALAQHDAIVRGAVESNSGYVFATGGDGFAAAFGSAGEAVAAAERAQAALDGHPFIRVRMGVHTGEVQERDGDYFGPAVNQAARIMDAGHGGQVLLSEVSAALVEADCVDLGEHSFSGISGLVAVRQLGSSEFPAIRAGPATALNLPVYRTSLIGRDELVASIRSALGPGSLVTLTGVGGVGKTRLAVEVADKVSQDFPDGVFFVGLAQLGDGAGLPRVVLSELGLEGAVSGDPLDVLGSVLGSGQMLLVLDNCEHVIADAAELVEFLLDRCRELTVLATSREGLAVPGEQLVAVPPLASKVVDGEVTSERVRMLIDRALAANPSRTSDPYGCNA
jgi:class 3 adenylate cyclase